MGEGVVEELRPPLYMGTEVPPFGRVVMIGHPGERYYWLQDKRGTISMIPAAVLEPMHDERVRKARVRIRK